MAGRPRKPAALKTGHHSNQDELKREVKMEKFLGGQSGLPMTPPDTLKNNKSAQWYYRYIVTGLKASGVLMSLDRFVVVQTAICLSRMNECDRVLDQQGLFCHKITKSGCKVAYEHPAVNEKKIYMQQFKTLSIQLGLSPSSRSKLASVDANEKMEKKDPLNRILNHVPKNLNK